MDKLLIYTAGSASRELKLMIDQLNEGKPTWNIIGFLDEDPNIVGQEVEGIPVYDLEHKEQAHDVYGICPVLDPLVRQRIIERNIEGARRKLATILFPTVALPRDLNIGPGSIVMPGALIGYNVKIGKGVLIWWRSLIGHDLCVGDYSSILSSANITGRCSIGKRCTIGAGATLNVGVTVGDDSIVGIGTTIFQNVGAKKSVVAIPRLVSLDR